MRRSEPVRLALLDSTLREGAQSPGVSFTVEDKLNIARALDELGIGYIEAGNPGSNPKDLEFFKRIAERPLKRAVLCAFGSTRRKGIGVAQDKNIAALAAAGTKAVTIFGKSWDLHVKQILKTTHDENLRMIEDSIAFLKECGKYVIYDAEHFFDGYLADANYAVKTLMAARSGGADVLCLCDTRGGTFPMDIYRITASVKELLPNIALGIHCHNDAGMAVAQSLSAVEAGAVHIQGTLTGIGERCGNANLATLIGDLQLLKKIRVLPGEDIKKLTGISRRVADVLNTHLSPSAPFVGSMAFAHKAGMHIDGVKKSSKSFEITDPSSVGNKRRFLISEVAGKASLLKKLKDILPEEEATPELLDDALKTLKQREYEGYQYESAEQSLELLMRSVAKKLPPYYALEYFKIIGERPLEDNRCPSSAIVKVRVGDAAKIAGAEGNGPVHALDLALRSALETFYPSLTGMRLTDYKVRVLESSNTTAAKVRVLITSSDGAESWNTVGVSTDIIEASFIALNDSIVYKLMKGEVRG